MGDASAGRGLFDEGLHRRTLAQEEQALRRRRQQKAQEAEREKQREEERLRQLAGARELHHIEEQLERTRTWLLRDSTGRADEPYFVACFRRLARLEGELRVLQQPHALRECAT